MHQKKAHHLFKAFAETFVGIKYFKSWCPLPRKTRVNEILPPGGITFWISDEMRRANGGEAMWCITLEGYYLEFPQWLIR